MVRKISKKIVELVAKDDYTKQEMEEMDYVLRIILFESIKLISTIIVFSIFGFFIESVIVISVMSLTKPFIGGYHEETQLKCFIATMLLTAGIITLSLNTSFTFLSNFIILIMCVFCIYNQAPIINPKMPITCPHLKQKNRKRGLLTTILCLIISLALCKYNDYYLLITWTIIFQTLLMFNRLEKN